MFYAYLGGVLIGSILMRIRMGFRETHGELLIDPNNDTCQIKMSTEKVITKRTRRVILVVNHNADLSQK